MSGRTTAEDGQGFFKYLVGASLVWVLIIVTLMILDVKQDTPISDLAPMMQGSLLVAVIWYLIGHLTARRKPKTGNPDG